MQAFRKISGRVVNGALEKTARRGCAAAAVSASSSMSSSHAAIRSPDTTFIARPPRNLTWQEAKDHLLSVQPTQYSTLSNGFKVAVEHTEGLEFVTIGIWIDAGSRFETRENNGVAHFLEHMNFKGCAKYTKAQIESVFEHLGAHFNAYTSRDRTAYYIKVFNKDVPLVMDLLADILKNGIYDRRYIEMERRTILDEMREVEELVEEVVMDNMHIAAYDSTHCGLPLTILGPTDNIAKHIDRKMILDYIDTHYTAPRMTLVCCGGLSHAEVHAIAEKHFSDLSPKNNRPVLQAQYVGGTATLWNKTMLTAHAHIAFPVCGAAHKDVITLQLLHYFYGSYRREAMQQFAHQGKNAERPFFADLEKTQFFYTPYEETGLMGYQLVTVPSATPEDAAAAGGGASGKSNTLGLVFEHIMSTIRHLIAHPPPMAELEAAKCAYKTSQLIMVDGTTNAAETLGRQMVHFSRKVPLQEHFELVDQVTPQVFSNTLAKYFDNVRPTISAAGSPAALPHFDALFNVVERLK